MSVEIPDDALLRTIADNVDLSNSQLIDNGPLKAIGSHQIFTAFKVSLCEFSNHHKLHQRFPVGYNGNKFPI